MVMSFKKKSVNQLVHLSKEAVKNATLDPIVLALIFYFNKTEQLNV